MRQKKKTSIAIVGALIMSLTSVMSAQMASAQGPLPIGGDPTVDPTQFRTTVFASGLDYPYGIAELADGSLLVASSSPDGTSLFASTGELLRFVDADDDGVADAAGAVLYTGLPGVVTGLVASGNLVFVSSSGNDSPRISVLRVGVSAGDPLSLEGSIEFTFPAGFEHRSYGLAVQPAGGDLELFFNIGAAGNDTSSVETVGVSGLVSGQIEADSVHRVTITDSGNTLTASGLILIARGLRNGAALGLHPVSGDLHIAENGIDIRDGSGEPLSADELNVVQSVDIGGAV